MNRHYTTNLAAAGRALLLGLAALAPANGVAAQHPDFLYVVQHSFREDVGGTLNGMQRVQTITDNSPATAGFASTIDAQPVGFQNLSNGSFTGQVQCQGGSVYIEQRLDYDYRIRNALYIHDLRGTSQVQVYALAPPGRRFRATIGRGRSLLQQPGVVTASASTSGPGSGEDGEWILTTRSQSLQFKGKQYSLLTTLGTTVRIHGGRTCIIGCSLVEAALGATAGIVASFSCLEDYHLEAEGGESSGCNDGLNLELLTAPLRDQQGCLGIGGQLTFRVTGAEVDSPVFLFVSPTRIEEQLGILPCQPVVYLQYRDPSSYPLNNDPSPLADIWGEYEYVMDLVGGFVGWGEVVYVQAFSIDASGGLEASNWIGITRH